MNNAETSKPCSSLVLEIGSGHNPSPQADVLVDKYFHDDTERGGNLCIDRPLVLADGERLPFRAGAFSFSLARQVMEHTEDIAQFFTELMRVSSAGRLTAPGALREMLFFWPYHRWLIVEVDGVLHCKRKDFAMPPHGRLLHELWKESPALRWFIGALPEYALRVDYRWQDTIRFSIDTSLPLPDLHDSEAISAWLKQHSPRRRALARALLFTIVKPPMLATLQRGYQRLFRRANDTRSRKSVVNLDTLLACPLCHTSVSLHTSGGTNNHAYLCSPCNRKFPIVEGIPDFRLNSER